MGVQSVDGPNLHRPYGLCTKPPPPGSLNYCRSGVQDWTTKKVHHKGNTPPPKPQLATWYVEAGAKLRENRGGQTLSEDISELGGGRDIEDPDVTDSNPVTNEVQVDLHMFRPLMLNWVGGRGTQC
jgi:hypothetical protein